MVQTTVDWQPANLEDSFVKLQPLREGDFEALFKVAADPLIWEQHPERNRYQREVFRHYFDSAMAGKAAFLIIDKTSRDIIGCTRYYDYLPHSASVAIGFTFLARACWGGRYNSAVKKLMLDYAFRFVDKVYFHIGAANMRSQLATSRFGALKVAEVNRSHNGQDVLHYEYLIRKHDWIQ